MALAHTRGKQPQEAKAQHRARPPFLWKRGSEGGPTLSPEAWLSHRQPVTLGEHTSPYTQKRLCQDPGQGCRSQGPMRADLGGCFQVHPLAMSVGGRFPFFLELFLQDVDEKRRNPW